MKTPPISSKFSNSMRQMLGSLMNSRNSLKVTQDESGTATISGTPSQISRADTLKVNENIYDMTPEIYKALTYPTYTGKNMKNENDISMMYNIIGDLGYTGVGDRYPKKIFTKTLPKLVIDIQNRCSEDITDSSDNLGEGIKLFIPSNKIDIYTRLQILLGLKLSGHTDTLTETSNLIDELYQRA